MGLYRATELGGNGNAIPRISRGPDAIVRRLGMRNLLCTLSIILLLGVESRSEKKALSFNAPDGFTLKGAFYTTGRPGPGVLLLHQCNADHQLYDDLGALLSTAGYNVLAFDFRGLGQSKGGEFTNFAA